ncbi:MAG: glycosyltransferase family 4 protein [Anaerolineae bacterium]|nr:glycosyltransferase family 4 protein [Anaerolineae bacterium]NUQ06150.1 glycosyltransferase family 4 protein [Anaerolineae bacterium]
MTATQGLSPVDPGKLKILICLLYYFPHRTGLTIHVQRVAEELVRRGHHVTVLTARYSDDLPRDDIHMHEGVRVVRLWAPIHMSRGMIMPAYPWAALKLMLEHDVVSVHTPMLETALIALLSLLTGTKIVATHHGDLILPSGFINRLIQNTMFLMYRLLANRASRLLAYSQDYAEHSYYLRPFLDKTSVVYPPIQMPPPNPEAVARLRAQWSSDGGPVIGFAGRFVEEKRPDLAIRALEVINRRYPRARLVFAGEYDIKYEETWQRHQALVQQYRDQIIFLGLLKEPQEMADFFAACDVLVLPSDSECFALVQVEAMLSGTPVVMTNIPGGRVPVTETGMGLLAAPGDAVSIGEALAAVLDDPARYRKTREQIAEVFSFKETVDRYEQHFRQHAKRRRS